ncbi:MAG: FecR domain-containing protein [Proteobacteria bacterium]|nr:FecR domain-containing protein [Pseudomonadota bacterium]
MRSLILLMTAFILVPLLVVPVCATVDQEPVARIAALRNQAMATNVSGEKRALQVRDALYEGDTIVTGTKARLQLLFTDNTIISLGRATTFVINDYLWQPDTQTGKFHSEVKEGIFRVMGGKLTKVAPQNFTTKTPAATIGIRGSMYAGVVAGENLSVVFLGGTGIVVSNEFGSVEIPKPGYGTHVRAKAPPPPATAFSGADMDAFTTGFNGTDDDGTTNDSDTDDGGGTPPADEPGEPTVVDVPVLPPPSDIKPLLETTGIWTPPTDGITHFRGTLGGTSLHFADGSLESINETVDIYANWHNHKVLGLVYDPLKDKAMPVFFFGDIVGNMVANVKIYGNSGGGPFDTQNPLPGDISVVEGTGSGSFLGTDTPLFQMTATGADYAIEPATQPATGSWQVQGLGQEMASGAALTGTETWGGYAVGISEDMNNIDTNRRLLTSNPGGFSLSINKDTGNISGTLSASDGAFTMNTITVGGAYGSAFIHDDLFAAILGGGSVPLKNHGNFLITGPKDKQFMEYATWGYWEVAYTDAGKQYHNHVPGAMWVAGQPTSVSDLAALASNSVVGNYSGQVMASKIDTASSPQVSEVGGAINLNINFANLGTTSAITGNMALDGNSFTVDTPGTAGNPLFTSTLNGGSFSGFLNGTMYGPNAQSVGGNFKTSDGTLTYQGIYGGNR